MAQIEVSLATMHPDDEFNPDGNGSGKETREFSFSICMIASEDPNSCCHLRSHCIQSGIYTSTQALAVERTKLWRFSWFEQKRSSEKIWKRSSEAVETIL